MASVKIVTLDTASKAANISEDTQPEDADSIIDLVFRAMLGCGYHSASIIRAMREYENEYGCENGEVV